MISGVSCLEGDGQKLLTAKVQFCKVNAADESIELFHQIMSCLGQEIDQKETPILIQACVSL